MLDRRQFLLAAGAGASWLAAPGAFAGELARTPPQTEGPFYPNHLPLDCDNDLIVVGNSLSPAVGTITHLSGRVLTAAGEPLRNATVEIWQVDAHGAYIHTGSSNRDKRDPNFQGFGRFETGSSGEYRFRTVRPVPYDNRTAHIHFALNRSGRRILTTQLYIEGEPLNARDFILRTLPPDRRRLVVVPFTPVAGSRVGELSARFDIVVGNTPADAARA